VLERRARLRPAELAPGDRELMMERKDLKLLVLA
jgi:hypothetical protein